MGKSQEYTFQALKEERRRSHFQWKGLDSANGSEFINHVLYKYCRREGLEFTRSRASRKNDNAYIEEKRKTKQIDPYKKLVPRLVTSYMMQQHPVGLPT